MGDGSSGAVELRTQSYLEVLAHIPPSTPPSPLPAPSQPSEEEPGPEKWKALALLVLCTICGMSTWFSASAVLPVLGAEWGVDDATGSLLTIMVNVGFLVGALCSSFAGFVDYVAPSTLIAVGAMAAGIFNAMLLVPGCGFRGAIALRFFGGWVMALVYPMAGKVTATWFTKNRGLAMGCILGAVTVGSAAPHLINALRRAAPPGESLGWRPLVAACSVVSGVGGLLAAFLLREGPLRQARKMAQWSDLKALGSNKQYLYASLAYLGHNWEIYAFWSWARQFASGVVITGSGNITATAGAGYSNVTAEMANATITISDAELYSGAWSVMHNHDRDRGAALVAFLVIAVGFVGCFAGGYIADRWGRVSVCLTSLTLSGIASLVIGEISSPQWTLVVAVVWGFTVVSDSAQYSTIVTEVVNPELLGTAMTAQFGFGYLSTFPSIYLVPAVVAKHGWAWGWRLLAPGSAIGIVALVQLNRLQAVDGKLHAHTVQLRSRAAEAKALAGAPA